MSNNAYKVMWKYPSVAGSFRGDYLVENLEELLRLLNKSEGVSRESCECIYIHQMQADGTAIEVYTYDVENKNVVNIVEASLKRIASASNEAPKPRVRLKTNKDSVQPTVQANYGRYTAYEAV